ncbi:ATP-grasp fold amidoligase family protein [Tabrizicola sp.]|uniref:ATP-grasp fold amidoligase family protein n=1 Tax=Tabrizicola sp. TaxID=2005166 RepID=UPI0026271292|nr:ATP-grasp fold amidoligase family protein [Tabrizicola sp.]MDM7931210.1 ATP-grasp fold amidoligase family protein [Tabrizicola sp.]
MTEHFTSDSLAAKATGNCWQARWVAVTPEASQLVHRIRKRQRLGARLFRFVPGAARRNRLIHDFTFRSDAEAVAFPFALKQGRLPDFNSPRVLAEKVRWTFLHHRNPLMPLISDKIAVRDYLHSKGAQIAPPKLIATGWKPEDILRMELPERFALKASNSCGANHFHTGPAAPDRKDLRRKLQLWRDADHWRRHGELFYRDIPWRFLVEEFLPSDHRRIEYKIMCFHGEPAFISAISQRGPGGLQRSVRWPDWSPAGFGTRGISSSPTPPDRPEMLDQLLAEARRLSEDLMHVRVDFLHYDHRLVFSELTLSNAAMRTPIDPPEADEWLGGLVDLSREAEYAERGRAIAKALAWPPVPPGRRHPG